MRDSMKPCQHSLSDGAVYKDVVVIGNGPSGMVTSFMLAGNVPYLKTIPEDLPIDEMLRARLSNVPPGQSLYEADLMELAEGLEGRNQNPISLLMDNLMRPCADLGIQADSLLEWKYEPDKQIEHIVLGRGPAGGAWHTFPPAVRTLSPGAWLTLPPHAAGAAAAERLPASAVAKYCRRYVHACKLQRYFRCGVIVNSVTVAPRAPGAPCGPGCPLNANFRVSGFDTSEGRGFSYVCRRVVVASGGGGRRNELAPAVARHAVHSLAAFDRALHQLPDDASDDRSTPPVLVVGSGLSAADAVWMALRGGKRTHHLHRAPADTLAHLSPHTYPDYSQVYKMMCDGQSGNYPNYTSYPNHIIVDVIPLTPGADALNLNAGDIEDAIRPKRVKLLNLVTNDIIEITVSVIAVFIGSKPDLFFLQTNFDLNCIDVKTCIKCIKEKSRNDIETENQRQCFLKNHWHYLKSVLGQSIQSCKSRYLNYTEINGNTDTKCFIPDCNGDAEKCKCKCNNVNTHKNNRNRTDDEITHYSKLFDEETKCQCQETNPYSSGIGFGIDPKKPVDCKSNPIAIDKSTHEILNAPKGMYALGPLTADNFVRFIPGGALAIVAHIHKENKTE